jgi:hypothetical protein
MALAPSADAPSTRGVSERTLRVFCVLLAIVLLGSAMFGSYTVGTHHPTFVSPCAKKIGVARDICEAKEQVAGHRIK